MRPVDHMDLREGGDFVGRAASAEAETAFMRSAAYHAIAIGFSPPDGPAAEYFACPESAKALGRVFVRLGFLRAGDLAMGIATRKMDASTFWRLFGHTARGEVSPFETEYGRDPTFRQPSELADISGFLRAFGLSLSPTEHGRPDHIQVECEFMSFLAMKEAISLRDDDLEGATVTMEAESAFLEAHLGRFAPAFAASVCREDPRGFYGALGRALLELVRSESRRFGVELGSEALALRDPLEEEGVPAACGQSDDPACGACEE